MRSRYKCTKCNHGYCILTVEGEEGEDMPERCPYDKDQETNWSIEAST